MSILRKVLVNWLPIILALLTDPSFRRSLIACLRHRGKEVLALTLAGLVVAVRHLIIFGVLLCPGRCIGGERVVPFQRRAIFAAGRGAGLKVGPVSDIDLGSQGMHCGMGLEGEGTIVHDL